MEKGVPIRSISRAIAVLQAVNRHGSLTLMEMANEAAVPYPTACRIVQTLLFEGLIEREPARKRYRPTPLVQTLSHGFQSDDRLVIAARPHIVALTRKNGWPVSVTTRVGHTMMVRDSTHTLTSLTLNNYFPGYTLPLLESASGRVCLAYMEEDEREGVLQGLAAIQDESPGPFDMLSLFRTGVMVDDIRNQGFATKGRNPFTENPGKTSAIAVPLMERGRAIGSMSLIFFASSKKMDDAVKQFLPDLKATSAAIEASLSDRTRTAA